MLGEIIQANFVSLVGLIFIMFFITINPLFKKKQNKKFQFAIFINILLLIITSLDFVFANSSDSYYVFRRMTSFLNFAGGPAIPLLLWIIFSEQKLKFWAYLPLLLNASVAFFSMFYKLIFSITDVNTYGRGPLFFLPVVTSIFYLVMIILQPVKQRYSKHTERVFLMFVILFMLVSVSAEVLVGCQFINYNTCAISLILYYLLLAIQATIVDSLTGSYNRFLYEHDLHKMEGSTDCIITMLDINHFKQINDCFGHSKGDQCLVYFANCFMTSFAASKVYRIGGDEFVILSKKSNVDLVEQKLKEVRNTLNEQHLDFAYGVYEYHKHQNITECLQLADELMYANKKNTKKYEYSTMEGIHLEA